MLDRFRMSADELQVMREKAAEYDRAEPHLAVALEIARIFNELILKAPMEVAGDIYTLLAQAEEEKRIAIACELANTLPEIGKVALLKALAANSDGVRAALHAHTNQLAESLSSTEALAEYFETWRKLRRIDLADIPPEAHVLIELCPRQRQTIYTYSPPVITLEGIMGESGDLIFHATHTAPNYEMETQFAPGARIRLRSWQPQTTISLSSTVGYLGSDDKLKMLAVLPVKTSATEHWRPLTLRDIVINDRRVFYPDVKNSPSTETP